MVHWTVGVEDLRRKDLGQCRTASTGNGRSTDFGIARKADPSGRSQSDDRSQEKLEQGRGHGEAFDSTDLQGIDEEASEDAEKLYMAGS